MLHNGNYMNEIIENIAVQAGFIKDKYGLYWDNDDNKEGVDLERFAELIIKELADIVQRDSRINWLNAVQIAREMRDLMRD